MEVILLEKIGKLGHLGDKVNVKDGYARNFLIPSGKALRATKANMEMFEAKKAELAKVSEEAKKNAEALAVKIKGKSFVVIRQAGDTGHLYGSVSTRDLAGVLKASGADVEYTKITIDTPIKEIGIYEVKVALHPEIVDTVKINVARSEEEAKVAELTAEKEAKLAKEKAEKAKVEAKAEKEAKEAELVKAKEEKKEEEEANA